MTTIFSGGLRPNPGPDPRWDTTQRERADRIRSTVVTALRGHPTLGIVDDAGADHEDFWEDACRIAAAWDAASGDITFEPAKTSWTAAELQSRLGPVSRDEEGGQHVRDRELLHPVAVAYGGREFALLTIDTEQEIPDDLYGWMSAQAAAGVSEVVLKSAERKGGVWAVPVSTETFRNHDAVLDALGWAAVRLDGRRGALLGQPKLQLQYEYRCFVVDGQVVTAAGCVEEFTPLDALPGEPFDTRVRRDRGHLGGTASPVTDEPEVVARLLELGRRAAEEHGGTVVIDVALDADRQRPVVVELNGLPNSGLYASAPWLLARTLMDAADRGY